MKTINECEKKIAKKYGLGSKLAGNKLVGENGERYWKEAIVLFAEEVARDQIKAFEKQMLDWIALREEGDFEETKKLMALYVAKGELVEMKVE